MASKYRLKQISPQDVDFSDFNPRGEKPEDIHQDETFEQLKDSVYRFGVLVPIVVRPQQEAGKKPFVLVDGERRLRAALETGIRRIPAHVTQSGEHSLDLIQAFHIHMLRKQWRSVAQARALQRIIEELRRTGDTTSRRELFEELQDRTGCTDTQLKSLRRAIKYPEAVLKEVDEGKLRWSHLVQIEESFVEQMSAHYPELLESLGRRRVREALVDKARKKILGTRSLIDNIRPIITAAQSREERAYASRLFETFVTEEDMTAEEVLKRYDKRFPPGKEDVIKLATRLTDAIENVTGMLDQMDTSRVLGFPAIAQRLDKSLRILRASMGKQLRALKKVLQ
jgi:ParB/RepB/Spo0J family partition protein